MSKLTNNCPQYQKNLLLWKKARKKHFGNFLAMLLANEPKTKLRKSYINSFYCSSEIQQTGAKLTSKYCKTRWCNTCNNIRTAKLINTYSDALLNKVVEPYFVTLTLPNVPAELLKPTIQYINKTSTKILKTIKDKATKEGLPVPTGIKKLECTYNHKSDNYHPHLHIIVDGLEHSQQIVKMWLSLTPSAVSDAQKIVKCYGNYHIELFKYFTKIVSKVGTSYRIFPTALDTIFNALVNQRIYASFGALYGLKCEEEFTDLEAVELDGIEQTSKNWLYSVQHLDWLDDFEHKLSNYQPSQNLLDLLNTNFNGEIVEDHLEEFALQSPEKSNFKVPKYDQSIPVSNEF